MKKVFLLLILSLTLLSGCVEKQNCTTDQKICPDGTMVGRILPDCQFAECPPKACTAEALLCPDGSAVGRTGPNCEFAPCPEQSKAEQQFEEIKTEIEQDLQKVETFTVYADDAKLSPPEITVKKGDKVKIIFMVDKDEVYYGGLDFRSEYFNTGTVLPGNQAVVEFIADKTFQYTSYWPKSSREKAIGTVNII